MKMSSESKAVVGLGVLLLAGSLTTECFNRQEAESSQKGNATVPPGGNLVSTTKLATNDINSSSRKLKNALALLSGSYSLMLQSASQEDKGPREGFQQVVTFFQDALNETTNQLQSIVRDVENRYLNDNRPQIMLIDPLYGNNSGQQVTLAEKLSSATVAGLSLPDSVKRTVNEFGSSSEEYSNLNGKCPGILWGVVQTNSKPTFSFYGTDSTTSYERAAAIKTICIDAVQRSTEFNKGLSKLNNSTPDKKFESLLTRGEIIYAQVEQVFILRTFLDNSNQEKLLINPPSADRVDEKP
jgi:hypothetical protein